MTPIDYLNTPADLYFELSMTKAAWNEGIEEEKRASKGPQTKE